MVSTCFAPPPRRLVIIYSQVGTGMIQTRKSRLRIILAAIVLAGGLGLATGSEPAGGEAPDGATVSTHGSIFRDCTEDCPEMVVIGPGNYQMGSTKAEQAQEKADRQQIHSIPRHLVTIGYAFALGKYDVTRAEFSAFVRDTGYQIGSDCSGFHSTLASAPPSEPPRVNWRDPGFRQTDRDPVVCVSWDDAQAYLAWLSRKTHRQYRLPSEAEWEYAARAGTSTLRYWGDAAADACRYANVADLTHLTARKIQPESNPDVDCSDGYAYTSPVGSFPPNPFGLYDMLGNVFQLTEDCLNYNYFGAPSDGSAWLSGVCVPRMSRGGSYATHITGVRAAYRSNLPTFYRADETGFRIARDL